ncbi:MAG: hypothetical protein HOO93_11185 [Methyloglobulus sp.]|mgnify:CR=1 FL=1|nr:hypothetical protein [Methyloglobulus sp.]
MGARNENNIVLKKPTKQARFSPYSREITLAVLVKFLLLAGLWWLFFAGHKQPVDEVVIAAKIFGANQPEIQAPKTPEKP